MSAAAFDDLTARVGRYPGPPADPAAGAVRVRRLLETDPGGAWVAECDGELCGVALALVREGLWILSLLVVRPEAQSSGVGRELLARARAHGEQARGFVILASRDDRALRSYVRLGLDLHPALHAVGRPRGVHAPEDVRPWRPEDRDWMDAIGRAVRGAAHGGDLDAFEQAGETISVLPERGYAVARGDALRMLTAADDEAASALLEAHLASARNEAVVEWLTSSQQWAFRTCVAAGMRFEPGGAVMTGGELAPLTPFLPSTAYL